MPDDEDAEAGFEAETETPPQSGDGLVEKEREMFGKGHIPNTAKIPLWNNGFINFNPDSHVSVFALISLVLLLLSLIIISVAGIFIADGGWLEKATSALGYGITAVVGAIVGSAASKR